jgi:hypothetical protein
MASIATTAQPEVAAGILTAAILMGVPFHG